MLHRTKAEKLATHHVRRISLRSLSSYAMSIWCLECAGQFKMNIQENKKFVLALENEINGVCKMALTIAGPEGSVLIARTVESALEFARLYKPTHAVVSQTQTLH